MRILENLVNLWAILQTCFYTFVQQTHVYTLFLFQHIKVENKNFVFLEFTEKKKKSNEKIMLPLLLVNINKLKKKVSISKVSMSIVKSNEIK